MGAEQTEPTGPDLADGVPFSELRDGAAGARSHTLPAFHDSSTSSLYSRLPCFATRT
jgi:hypothetical protein